MAIRHARNIEKRCVSGVLKDSLFLDVPPRQTDANGDLSGGRKSFRIVALVSRTFVIKSNRSIGNIERKPIDKITLEGSSFFKKFTSFLLENVALIYDPRSLLSLRIITSRYTRYRAASETKIRNRERPKVEHSCSRPPASEIFFANRVSNEQAEKYKRRGEKSANIARQI